MKGEALAWTPSPQPAKGPQNLGLGPKPTARGSPPRVWPSGGEGEGARGARGQAGRAPLEAAGSGPRSGWSGEAGTGT